MVTTNPMAATDSDLTDIKYDEFNVAPVTLWVDGQARRLTFRGVCEYLRRLDDRVDLATAEIRDNRLRLGHIWNQLRARMNPGDFSILKREARVPLRTIERCVQIARLFADANGCMDLSRVHDRLFVLGLASRGNPSSATRVSFVARPGERLGGVSVCQFEHADRITYRMLLELAKANKRTNGTDRPRVEQLTFDAIYERVGRQLDRVRNLRDDERRRAQTLLDRFSRELDELLLHPGHGSRASSRAG